MLFLGELKIQKVKEGKEKKAGNRNRERERRPSQRLTRRRLPRLLSCLPQPRHSPPSIYLSQHPPKFQKLNPPPSPPLFATVHGGSLLGVSKFHRLLTNPTK